MQQKATHKKLPHSTKCHKLNLSQTHTESTIIKKIFLSADNSCFKVRSYTENDPFPRHWNYNTFLRVRRIIPIGIGSKQFRHSSLISQTRFEFTRGARESRQVKSNRLGKSRFTGTAASRDWMLIYQDLTIARCLERESVSSGQ